MGRPRAVVAMALTGLVVTGTPAAAHAASATSSTASTASTRGAGSAEPAPDTAGLPAGRSWNVTLLTGDVVHLRTVRGGPPLVSVTPGPGRRHVPFVKDIRPDGTVRVIPQDVASRIGKVYDPALFDVTALIKDGDDDATRSDLPLIVQGAGIRAFSARRTLHSIDATVVRAPKTKTVTLAAEARSGEVRHVWLDRRVHARALPRGGSGAATTGRRAGHGTRLDHNLTQIGAPAAWRAGANGTGVEVAVLDTGVDATHPDLKGRIAGQKNFSDSADTVDRVGHGTHVAATIAGTGASANGRRRGVAYDAKLLIGKVLDDQGYGRDSDVIAGMEWAAPQARIVSMSLGAWAADPSDDPVAKALDALSAKDDALFVVAAGNDGAQDSVETPGAASSALTVGAVDGKDHVADFSSRGGALMKPEIAAPGVDIVAARAAGTSMGHVIDAHYTSASGTSMATPHVAGAAADLLQEHPSWTAARLKAALASTADKVPGTYYEVGAGRLDVGTAVRATVVGDQATAAFGHVPYGSTASRSQKVSWTNTGTHAVTLRLAAGLADREGAASHALGLPPTVTVPAGGSASVALTLDPRRLTTAGYYSGAVTATGGGVTLRTAVGAYAEPQTHTLTLKATALPGTPDGALGGYVGLIDVDDPNMYSGDVEIGDTGVAHVRVPDGHYAVLGTVDDTTEGKARSAFVGDAEVNVRADTTVPLDASHAQPVRLSAPGMRPDPSALQGLEVERGIGSGVWESGLFAFDGSPEVYTTPVGRVHDGTLRAYALTRLTDGGKTVVDVLHDLGPRVPAKVDYTADAARMARLDQRFHALNGDVKDTVGQKRYGITPAGFLVNEASGDVAPGSVRTDYVSAEKGVQWLDEGFSPVEIAGIPVLDQRAPRHYAAGSRHAFDWARQPFRPGPYSATVPTPSFCAPGATTRARGNIHVELVDLQEAPDATDCLTYDEDWAAATTHKMTLYAGGRKAGTVTRPYGDFSVPARPGRYRLVYDVDASKVLPVSTRTHTGWTFRSRPGRIRIPLLTVDYALPLDLLGRPDGDTATFTVARVKGAARARPTGLRLWTSLDDGATWHRAAVRRTGADKFTGALPHAGKGQAVSLRVQATDSGGGKIDQTIIRAYFGG